MKMNSWCEKRDREILTYRVDEASGVVRNDFKLIQNEPAMDIAAAQESGPILCCRTISAEWISKEIEMQLTKEMKHSQRKRYWQLWTVGI
jgi:hypothetical protein